MSNLRVLVAGASIAGPATAYWLARAGAASVTVIERFPELRPGGQNIDIRSVGVAAMRKMPGMEEAVRARLCQFDGLALARGDGSLYGVLGRSGDPDQQNLVSEYEILRGDLSRILYDLTKDDERITYVFGEQIAALTHRAGAGGGDGPIAVDFANGVLPSAEYDLVVACDGAASRTRALGLGCGSRDHVIPGNIWSAYFLSPHDVLGGSRVAQAFGAVGGRSVGAVSDADGASRAIMMSVYPRGQADATLPFRRALKEGDEATKRFVAERFAGMGWKTPQILESMLTDGTQFYAGETLQVKVPSLSRGRFVMVGDAGYASGLSGVGTSLALAGAYLLAGEISKHGTGDLAAGLRGYEERMRPLINDMGQMPKYIGAFLGPQTSWGLWIRNQLFALIVGSRILDLAQKIFGGAFESSDKHPLPDYETLS
ncbi:oxidoreductase [Xylariomycetidae sp. FL2044]|nr:oxidoreductase [Xylariomycetidae sp. FL2044]